MRTPSDYVARGNGFFATRKYDDALLQYRKALQQDPNFGEAQYRIGLLELERGNAMDAFLALNRAVELAPENWEAKAKFADLCISLMVTTRVQPPVVYKRIVALGDEFLRRDPNSFDGLRLKGYIATLDRKPKEAVEYFGRALKTKPEDAVITAAYAEALLNDGQTAAGEEAARKLISRKKDYAPAYDALYRFYTAGNRLAEAGSILRQKAENNPDQAAYWAQWAGHLNRIGRPAEVTAVLQKILDDPKTFPDGKMTVGDFYAGIQRFDEAVALYEEGIRKDGARKLDYLKRIGNVYQRQGKREDALRTVDEILTIAPDDEGSSALRANLLRRSGRRSDQERSAEIFRRLIKKNPGQALWHMGLGRSLLDLGDDLNAARGEFKEALDRDPNLDLARYSLADVSLRLNHPEEALATAGEILARKPSDVQGRLLRAMAFRSMRNFEGARSELKRLAAEFPNAREVQFQFAVLALSEGKHREAGELFQKLYQASPSDFRPLQGLVDSRFAQKQIRDALKLLEAEVTKSPDVIQLRLLLAGAATRAGELALAAEQYRSMLALDPQSVGLQLSLGEVELKMNEPEKALDAFRKARDVAPNNPVVARAIAIALESAGQLEEAIQQYRQDLQLEPGNPVVQNNLAYLLAETGGDLEEAQRLIEEAVRKSPDQPAFNDTLGWIYLKKNMTGSARQVFARLVRKDPRNPFFQYHLGAALFAQGDREGARTALKAALEHEPPPLAEKKIRELLSQLG